VLPAGVATVTVSAVLDDRPVVTTMDVAYTAHSCG